MTTCDGHCGSPADGHTHLSMPDPPGGTRLDIIKEKLSSMTHRCTFYCCPICHTHLLAHEAPCQGPLEVVFPEDLEEVTS